MAITHYVYMYVSDITSEVHSEMFDDLSLNVTTLLQHKIGFVSKQTMTSKLHSFTPGRAGSQHLIHVGRTALHLPLEEGHDTNLLLPRKLWEV